VRPSCGDVPAPSHTYQYRHGKNVSVNLSQSRVLSNIHTDVTGVYRLSPARRLMAAHRKLLLAPQLVRIPPAPTDTGASADTGNRRVEKCPVASRGPPSCAANSTTPFLRTAVTGAAKLSDGAELGSSSTMCLRPVTTLMRLSCGSTCSCEVWWWAWARRAHPQYFLTRTGVTYCMRISVKTWPHK
jgi:hypothetical protein